MKSVRVGKSVSSPHNNNGDLLSAEHIKLSQGCDILYHKKTVPKFLPYPDVSFPKQYLVKLPFLTESIQLTKPPP